MIPQYSYQKYQSLFLFIEITFWLLLKSLYSLAITLDPIFFSVFSFDRAFDFLYNSAIAFFDNSFDRDVLEKELILEWLSIDLSS